MKGALFLWLELMGVVAVWFAVVLLVGWCFNAWDKRHPRRPR